MDIFRAEPHTTILFGRGTEEQVGNEVKLSGGSRVLIHYGDRRFVEQSLIDRVRHSFDEAGIDCYELGGVKKNTRIDVVEEGIKLCRDNQIDFVLSIGSGSVVGSAKAIAVGAVWDGDFRQNLERKREVSGALPVGLIVTVPGNGSELSNGVIVTEDPPEGKRGLTLWNMRSDFLYPKFVICNPELVTSFPKHLGLSFSNIFVRIACSFFNCGWSNDLNEEMCTATLRVMVRTLKKLQENPSDYDALCEMMWAGIVAYTRYTVEHEEEQVVEVLSLAFKKLYNSSHGEAVGLIFPVWCETVLYKDVSKMARLMSGTFGITWDGKDDSAERCAREGIARLRELFKEVGLPATFEDLGGSGEDIPLILDIAGLKDGIEIGSYLKLDRDHAQALLSLILMANIRHD